MSINEKLQPILDKIFFKQQKDKQSHMLVGLLIYTSLIHFINPTTSLLIVVIIATLKEVIDKVSGKGTPDYQDIIATAILPFIICFVYLILEVIILFSKGVLL